MRHRYHVLLVSSAGGVLLDLLALKPWWARHQTTWAVVKAADTLTALAGQDVCWVSERPGSRPWELVAGICEATHLLRRLRPDVIVSAGSGVAIGFFLAARCLGMPTFWLETLNMVGVGGISSRICTRIASEVLVQRASLLEIHPGAVLIGELY